MHVQPGDTVWAVHYLRLYTALSMRGWHSEACVGGAGRRSATAASDGCRNELQIIRLPCPFATGSSFKSATTSLLPAMQPRPDLDCRLLPAAYGSVAFGDPVSLGRLRGTSLVGLASLDRRKMYGFSIWLTIHAALQHAVASHPHNPPRSQRPLHSFSFLKCEPTADLCAGAVARQVGKSSGCSTHSLCATPASASLSASVRSCASPLISSTTCGFTAAIQVSAGG